MIKVVVTLGVYVRNLKELHALNLCKKYLDKEPNKSNIQTVSNVTDVPDVDPTAIRSCLSRSQRSVALQTCTILCKNFESRHLPPDQLVMGCLCDTAAQRSLITKACADRLGLKVKCTELVSLLGFGQTKPECRQYEVVNIMLGSNSNHKPITIDALVIKKISDIYMAGASSFAKRIEKKGYTLADERLGNCKSDVVVTELLIGADHVDKVISPYKAKMMVLGMWLSFTVFGGALLLGRIPGSSLSPNKNIFHTTVFHINTPSVYLLDSKEEVLATNDLEIARELNNYDALGIKLSSREEDDRKAELHYKSNMYVDPETKNYVVGFPWIMNDPPTSTQLDSNKFLVTSRFKSTMASLDKDPQKLSQYSQVHDKEVENDFIEKVPLQELHDPNILKHYINHFPVYKKDPSATTPCRRVFDGSLHRKGKPSLNDMMLKGSQMTPNILKILLILRLWRHLLTADISKAFLRMTLNMGDRNFTCFLARDKWNDPQSPISVWRFKSVLFGATSSPFMLNMSVADILAQNSFSHDLEVFVDNIFVKCDSSDQILKAADEAIAIFQNVGMPLHELASNVPSVNLELESKGLLTTSSPLKTLGLHWDFVKDTWTINKPEFCTESVTKRSILSDIAKVYDPLGLLSPITIQGRIIVQEAWNYGLNWDISLPQGMQDAWGLVVDQLNKALIVPIPRWSGFITYDKVSIHCFTDASERAMGTVVYLVSESETFNFIAKAKTCPLNMSHFTIPRKELTAFALGARLLKFTLDATSSYFRPDSVHMWSDSTTNLTWCTAKVDHKDIFIRNRVDDLKSKIGKYNIIQHYILSDSNPADMLTKVTGKSVTDEIWTKGPKILVNKHQWKEFVPSKGNVDSIPVFCAHMSEIRPSVDLPDISKFEGLNELYTATINERFDKVMSSTNLKKAEILWIKEIQRLHYYEELQFLKILDGNRVKSLAGKKITRSKKLQVPSLCLNFHLILDKEGVIRVQTSHANATNLEYDTKFPILLPVKNPFTKLVLKESHVQSGHFGLNYTRAEVRKKYWIPQVVHAIKTIVANCKVCIIERGQRYHIPDSPPLPSFRFNYDQPFLTTCVDMTGHFYIKDAANNAVKVYLIIFLCASTRCGHVEIVPDASTEAFANALDRFISRKGAPKLIISDQGSNFKGFSHELQEISNNIIIKDALKVKGMEWHWTPVGGPHFNGLVERQIGIIKSVIRKTINKKVLSFDQFSTVVAYAEGIFNERPLCPMIDDEDYVPITPNMLVYGHNLRHFNYMLSEIDLNDPSFKINNKTLNARSIKLKSTLAQARKIFISEYMHLLANKDASRQKSSPQTKSLIYPGVLDWVLLKGETGDLRIGQILKLKESEDGEIRQAQVKTKHSIGWYPLCDIRFMEYYSPEGMVDIKETTNCVKERRKMPKRAAALKAQQNFLINTLFHR